MKDMNYVFRNFFTHKDFLVPSGQIPGTMFTPLHFLFITLFLLTVFSSALYLAKHQNLLKPALASVWALMVIWEFAIIYYDAAAGREVFWDFKTCLSLYPCSLYLYTMPIILWGKGSAKQAGLGYLSTLGLMGAVINLLYPITRLFDYSCISFAGMHTIFFHGAMLWSFLCLNFSGLHSYDQASSLHDLLLPCIPTLILSVPANIANYLIGSDYMFFTGQFPVVAKIFGNTRPILITITMYTLYILVPALFYLRGYLQSRHAEDENSVSFFTADYT